MFWCGRRMVYIESGWIRYLYVTVWGCIYGRTEWRRWVSFAVDQIKWRQVLSLDREVLLFGGTASWPGLWIQWDVIWGSDLRQSFWVSYELALDHQIAGPGPLPEAGPAKCALTQGDLTVMIFWILPDPWRIPTREQEDNLLNQLFFYLLNQLVELSPRWRWQHERIALKHPRDPKGCFLLSFNWSCLHPAIICYLV